MKEKRMKKKMLMLIALATAVVSVGCGNEGSSADNEPVSAEAEAIESSGSGAVCTHTWSKATCTEPKTCSLCGETEGAALGHQWVEATFAEPKTCSLCGETEGDKRQTYFEEHGAEVMDAPVACTVNGLIYNGDDPENYQMTRDGVWEQTDCYSEPAEEDGYQIVYLQLHFMSSLYHDVALDRDLTTLTQRNAIYDWYTGRVLPSRDLFGSDAFEVETVLEIDGSRYTVSYEKTLEWEQEAWIWDDKGNASSVMHFYNTYRFKVPDGYDGLVFAAIPCNEYRESDTETIDESESYAFDEGYVEGTVFFRINGEGMVPERLPEN
ncbi:MAG: hypothetical protein NC417_12765 [Candidatus Gastranaerophilales bacterium]|nr:hypothetical protein [Candidatus Gastranaerophilales bacterium]